MGACIVLVYLHVLASDSGCDVLAPNSANVPDLAPDPSDFSVLFSHPGEAPVHASVSSEASVHFPSVWTKKAGGPFDPGIAQRSILKKLLFSFLARLLSISPVFGLKRMGDHLILGSPRGRSSRGG
ncbi:hypothetical protein XELAEV_18005917mg, partial [Xenopus laevis]